jgi:hypothetical protein
MDGKQVEGAAPGGLAVSRTKTTGKESTTAKSGSTKASKRSTDATSSPAAAATSNAAGLKRGRDWEQLEKKAKEITADLVAAETNDPPYPLDAVNLSFFSLA